MKIALVTGAYKGLGFEWCKQLHGMGYCVILTARDLPKAEKAAAKLSSGDLLVIPKVLDVTNESQLQDLSKWLQQEFGKIDLIVNNAGINPKDYKDKRRMAKAFYLNDIDTDELIEVIKVNSIAPLLVVKHFRVLLSKSEKPVVINISSGMGSISNLNFAGHYGYVGSKSLLNAFNKSMANELKDDKIICVNINPGWVLTDMGGVNAPLSPKESVSSTINNVLNTISMADSGKFLSYDGVHCPW
jgi:NAD(P)-dependent dehydrogenase (short-subunit alcohol dehydrogenase family)